jgi:hypothetical protein
MNVTATSQYFSQGDLKKLDKILNFIAGTEYSHPIVLYVCKELKMPVEQLLPKTFEDIQDSVSTREVNILRFEHYEARRKAKLNLVAEYILEKHLFSGSKNRTISKLYLVTSSDRNATLSSNSSFNRDALTERKANIIKNQIIKRLTVQENLKKLKKEEEESRLANEKKIKEKEKREKKYKKNTKIFEIRDQRIKERLEKKQKDIEENEIQALKDFKPGNYENNYFPLMISTSNGEYKYKYHSSTPTNNYIEVSFKQTTDENIKEKLDLITSKLNKSAIRAKKHLIEKASLGASKSYLIEKAKKFREETNMKKEEENIQKILKIQKSIEFSNVINK